MNTLPLIPRSVFFGNPDRTFVRISPDGERLAWLASRDGVLNVWVAPREAPAAARPVTQDTGRGIRAFEWAYTGNHILYIQDMNGDENWRVYSVDLTSGDVRDLTPFEGVAAQLLKLSHRRPNEALIRLNDRDPRWHDVYLIDIITGERRLTLQNERYLDITADDDLELRTATAMTADGGAAIDRRDDAGEWHPWESVPMEDTLSTQVLGHDESGRLVYMTDSRGRDTGALYAVDPAAGERRLLAGDDRVDAADLMYHPTRLNIQAVAFNYTRKAWRVLDPAIEGDLAYLATLADGEVTITSRSLDDRYWVAAFLIDNGPMRYYLYDRQRGAADFLFTDRAELEGLPLARMHPAIIPARDGVELVGYYSLPPDAVTGDAAIPDRPLPMVFTPHGGPWGRDEWGFNGWHQWLANRGYAVMSVNFRSSTGFGKAFTNAGDREWGGLVLQDQQDAVAWAVAQGIADPARVAVMGGSFGGYSTLAGLTFYPEVFACGVDIVGPSNLVTLLQTIPPYWQPMVELFMKRVGDLRTEEGRELLRAHSPLTYADRIQRPLLIFQGANDPRVKQAESDQIVSAMQANGIPVTYAVFPDEGHGFARPENNVAYTAVAEAFLSQCLGGRAQPIGDDLTGSSIVVPVGAGEVPGLVEALGGNRVFS